MEWLFGMSLLAETSAQLHDTDSAQVLYGLLRPWAAANVIDMPEGSEDRRRDTSACSPQRLNAGTTRPATSRTRCR
jgi:hypothetical protein